MSPADTPATTPVSIAPKAPASYEELVAALDAEFARRVNAENKLARVIRALKEKESARCSCRKRGKRKDDGGEDNATRAKKSSPTSVLSTAAAPAPGASQVISDCSDLSRPERRVTREFERTKTRTGVGDSDAGVAEKGVKKPGRRSRGSKRRPAAEKIPGQTRYWTSSEHQLFLEAISKFGHKNLRAISAFVGTRNQTQVRTHSQKYFMKLMREAQKQNPTHVDDQASANGNAAGDDTDEGSKNKESKYSVSSKYGLSLLCLVGQDMQVPTES